MAKSKSNAHKDQDNGKHTKGAVNNTNSAKNDAKVDTHKKNGHQEVKKNSFLDSIPSALLFPLLGGGIYLCYGTYGFLQEEIIAVEKIDAVIPLLSQYLIALLVSFMINIITDISSGRSIESFNFDELSIGFYNTMTMSASNYALAYVDYPTQALVKSSKILPVMAFGLVRKTYNYATYKYVCAFFITVGLMVFNVAKMGSKTSGMSFNAIGTFLLFLSLFMDGVVATQTDIVKKKGGKKKGKYHLMAASNFVGVLNCVAIIAYMYFVSETNVIDQITASNIKGILLIGACGTLGQICIYTFINYFDCFMLSIVNTSRKFFSILFSIVWFSHPLNPIHWAGICIVLGSITADVILSQMEKSKTKQKTA